MSFHRLTWRVGLPCVLLVLGTTGALAVYLREQVLAQERARLERVAEATATFVDTNSLPAEPELAAKLRRIGDDDIFFRQGDTLAPPAPEPLRRVLAAIPANNLAVHRDGLLMVAAPMPAHHADLVLVQRRPTPWFDNRVTALLGAFLLLAMLTAWLVVRGLVQPLRQLARQLPDIEKPEPIAVPSALRNDEIGDLARAFLRTRLALQEEQQARERMEKLAVLGRMTAALAHEVQNPIAAIRMHAQLLRAGHVGAPDAAATIELEASRIESLLNQWMFLSRPEPPVKTNVDVGAVLAKILALHDANAAHAAVTMHLDVEPGSLVRADGRRLEQVFRNLLVNALQAMPGGGTLTVRTRREGSTLTISFADTGAGFSANALQRFAEFFFSEREGGMGIGLAVASEIAKAHGGRLLAANGPHGGAVVTVELPALQESVAGHEVA